eukprot:COSAG01_NODE_23876_length_798_cov_1.804006_1_plen_108_part_10
MLDWRTEDRKLSQGNYNSSSSSRQRSPSLLPGTDNGQASGGGRAARATATASHGRTATQLAAQPSTPAPNLPFRLQRATDGGCTACGVAVSLDHVLAPSRAAVLGKHA